jgi:Ni/Co efflux regulator RcnB
MLFSTNPSRVLLVAFACAFISASALAGKPEWAGKGGKQHEKESQSHEQRSEQEVHIGGYFVEEQRAHAHEYYGKHYKGKKCPPGLAKKHNGCQPPGYAKKWTKGQPLDRTVVFYPVPQAVVLTMGPPPSGYQYVRVSNDILIIAIGTRLVVDAIEDLMQP